MSYTRFNSETEFFAARDTVLVQARHSIQILDQDLTGFRLDQAPVIATLHAFLTADPAAHLHVALHDISALVAHFPRFMKLMRRHAPRIQIRLIPSTLKALTETHLLADEKHGIRRFHQDFPRGALYLDDAPEVDLWWQRFNALWDLCAPCHALEYTGL